MTNVPQQINKILIIGPSWVGDMVMAQSLFKAIKADNPAAQIDVLAMDWTRPLLQRMPEVNEAISMPISHGVFGWKMRKQLGLQLRERRYDQAIVLPNSWKSALIPWFARIPIRTGWRGEMRFGLLNDLRRLSKQALPLMVQRFVSLAYSADQANSVPTYPLPQLLSKAVDPAINPPLATKQNRLVLCPGAEFGPAKQWPAEHYAAVSQTLIQEGWQVLILGSKADQSIANEIATQVGADHSEQLYNLAGTTSLEQAIDLLGTADCVVTNDSGLMHIAAAMQKPLIAVYGPTSPDFTPPLSEKAQIIQIAIDCSPCFQRTCPLGHQRCMKDLTPAQVITQIHGFFDE